MELRKTVRTSAAGVFNLFSAYLPALSAAVPETVTGSVSTTVHAEDPPRID